MAWRFKASKYKNAAPIVPKPEACVRDVCVGSYQTYGNNIAASAALMAFNWDHSGSSLAVLPLDDCGRKSKTMPLLHAHSDTVTDLDFSPFHDGLLATGSQDCLVKVWSVPENGLEESLSSPECTFSHKQRRVETVGFHPTAEFLLHSTSYTTLTLWDLIGQKDFFSNSDHSEVIQAVAWKRDGSLLATSCKDKQVRVLDPRSQSVCLKAANSHQSIKDSRIVWLGDTNRVLTTGFDAARLRQVIIRDVRSFKEPEKTLELDCSTGILIPLYDADTGMLFLAGKGDTTIGYMEVIDREPYLVEGIRHSGEQTKGACLVPKRALAVMQGEVNRLLQLTSSSVVPIMYQVPRKTYRDFHADLYPDTPGYTTELTAADWAAGKNLPVAKISLDPSKRTAGKDEPIKVHRGPLCLLRKEYEKNQDNNNKKPAMVVTSTYVPKVAKKEFKDNKLLNMMTIEKIDNDETRKKNGNDHVENDEKRDEAAEAGGKNKEPQQNGGNVPPKPLPRASRAGSVSEVVVPLPPVEEAVLPASRPVAKPRTTNYIPVVTPVNPNAPLIGGYKPRLGPKPFTAPKLSDPDLIEKLGLTPPSLVNQDSNGIHHHDFKLSTEAPKPIIEAPKLTPESPLIEPSMTKKSPIADKPDIQPLETAVETPISQEDENKEADLSNGDYKPKTPSTAERRRLFETVNSAKEDVEIVDSPADVFEDAFERSSVRSSIAEKRKMYENRSMSVQESTTAGVAAERLDKSPLPLRRKDSLKSNRNGAEDGTKKATVPKQQSLDIVQVAKKLEPATPVPKRTSTVFGRVSKFRHLKGTPAHKSAHIENIRNLSRQIPGECDGFQANPKRVAVPLSGPGGKIAVFELSRPGKLPDGVIPALVHGVNVMDFAWDPFDCGRLAVAGDDGILRLWSIPEASGLLEPTNSPSCEINAHSDKIYFVKFHPTARDVLATGSYDMSVKIWDLGLAGGAAERLVLRGHTEHIFCFAWSPCGRYCCTASKDGRLRLYRPRGAGGEVPLREGRGPQGTRGARVVWALDGQFIVVTGFDKVSERQIMVFRSDDLQAPLNTVGLDVSPAILMPFYDEDSSTLFLTGKGDTTIYTFEITEESPYICPLSHHRCNTLHQGLAFLPKNVCDVASVEFAKALRLTNTNIEPLSFTVPRIKSELFQDDLFPPTRITWKPTLSSQEWFDGKDKPQNRLDLKPEGMESLSNSQAVNSDKSGNKTEASNFVSQPFNRLGWNQEIMNQSKSKQDEIQKSVSSRVEVNLQLEQDNMEGVDEKEWEE